VRHIELFVSRKNILWYLLVHADVVWVPCFLPNVSKPKRKEKS